MQWITRVPATVGEAQAVLAQAAPQTMASLREGYRSRVVTSTYGGVAPRWVPLDSEPRQPPAQRTVAKQGRQPRDQEVKAFKTLGHTALACEADARQALARFAHDLQATLLHESTVCPTPRDGKRGRPGSGAPPAPVVYHIAGALASRVAARPALGDQQRCCILATNALDEALWPASAGLDGYKGRPMPNAAFASSKPPHFWPLRSLAKNPNASWPC